MAAAEIFSQTPRARFVAAVAGTGVGGFLARRVFAGLIVMVGLSILIFAIARVIPGDPARIALGPMASAKQIELMRVRLHLDQPIPVQYWEFVKGVSRGDLGMSIVTKRSVSIDLAKFLPASLELVFAAGLIMLVIGIPLGILAARYRDTAIDNSSRVFALLGVVSPSFVWAIFLMLVFSYWLGFLPVAGRLLDPLVRPPLVTGMYTVDALLSGQFAAAWDALRHLILPAIALALAGMGQAARLTRANMVESYDRQYIEMARAFSFSETSIALKYALRPALIPTLTILGLDFAALLGNAFLVEKVFNWPGLGRYGVRAMLQKDLNAIVGTVLVIGALFLIVNIVVDLVTAYMNPRIRLQGRRA